MRRLLRGNAPVTLVQQTGSANLQQRGLNRRITRACSARARFECVKLLKAVKCDKEPKMDLKPGQSGGVYVDVHIPTGTKKVDGLTTASERTVRLELPASSVGAAGKGALESALDHLASLVKENPQDAADLLEAATRNDIKSTREIAQRLGLLGPDIIWDPIIIIVIVIIILTAS